ncbi:3-methyladenine DNA glycosylase [Nocardioides sp.]|uniref:3-methyladenine DNA glycosylase n=1 Tax=Nocardioides sp. TaxID=35761 RepID=UPI00261E4375|nr:3-methyladenine DNA glycosylase [Nocardioides sp.]MCW2738536.1 3-methyladenine glycosylase [Nocardioides sp.]
MVVLSADEWGPLSEAHAARVDAFVAPHLARRAEQVKHPVHDFLFAYYSQRPAQLRRWHPGYGVGLEEAGEYAGFKGYEVLGLDTLASLAARPAEVSALAARPAEVSALAPRPADAVAVSTAYVVSQRRLLTQLHGLLTATAGRAPQFGCFGLHEWAMVHRASELGTRHDWPLRLGQEGTDAVVESHRIGCSHFDAFRFFTPTARPLNTLRPGRDDRPDFEQPGCLHAGMDLYKHAFRLTPMIRSDLVADCFELARDIRVVDMRAAPYDLTDLGFEPVPIETTEGKAAYVEAQRSFAERGAPLRARLIAECERLLAASGVMGITTPQNS